MSAGSRAVYVAFTALASSFIVAVNVFEQGAWQSLAGGIFGGVTPDVYVQTYLLDGIIILVFYATAFLSVHSISREAIDNLEES